MRIFKVILFSLLVFSTYSSWAEICVGEDASYTSFGNTTVTWYLNPTTKVCVTRIMVKSPEGYSREILFDERGYFSTIDKDSTFETTRSPEKKSWAVWPALKRQSVVFLEDQNLLEVTLASGHVIYWDTIKAEIDDTKTKDLKIKYNGTSAPMTMDIKEKTGTLIDFGRIVGYKDPMLNWRRNITLTTAEGSSCSVPHSKLFYRFARCKWIPKCECPEGEDSFYFTCHTDNPRITELDFITPRLEDITPTSTQLLLNKLCPNADFSSSNEMIRNHLISELTRAGEDRPPQSDGDRAERDPGKDVSVPTGDQGVVPSPDVRPE
ncbi:MAG: hypothetical protein HOE90_03710 [Bacteriovoracaceae bacterium]|nr:hypothetical protein [Bacteriovoracaceae bacterium]